MIEAAVPTLQLGQVDLHTSLLFPMRYIAAPVAVAHVIGFQPPRQRMFAARTYQPVGHQRQDATGPVVVGIFFRQQARPATAHIQDLPQTQLLEQVPRHEHGAPGAGFEDLDWSFFSQLLGDLLLIIFPTQQAIEHRQDGLKGIAASEVGDDLLLDTAVLTDRADNPHIFVNGA
ncbi:MAG: hypothetical protein V3R98_14010, partial [Alphaproteobacteria bacterium]